MKWKAFFITFTLFLYVESSLAQGVEGHDKENAAQASNSAGESVSVFQDCNDAWKNIHKSCTANPSLENEQAKLPFFQQTLSGAETKGAGENQEAVLQMAKPSRSAYQAIMSQCDQAMKSCDSVCTQQKIEANINPNKNSAKLISNADMAIKRCTEENKTVVAEATAKIIDLEKIIKAATAALEFIKGLGLGGDSDVSLTDSDDPCEKYNDSGILVGQCGNETSSTASRATGGLTGVGAAGLTDTSGDGLLQSSSSGEPGGSGLSSKAGTSAMNSGGSGLTGFGSMGSVGDGSAAAASGEAGLDTDIHKGFISADGGGTGSFSSGGGSKGVAAFGRGSTSDNGAAVEKAALQRKLSRYANSEKRGIATSGGKNGPFQDNWSIVKKAYKNNSNTMFHQK